MKFNKKTVFMLSLLVSSLQVQCTPNDIYTVEEIQRDIQSQKNDGTYEGSSPLHFATDGSDDECLTAVCDLINSGADVNDQNNFDQQTPLHVAVDNSSKGITKKLIESGANLNAQDINGKTALQFAAYNQHANDNGIAEMLINSGADVNIKNIDGQTAAMIAFEEGNYWLYNLLIDAAIQNMTN